MIKLKNTVKKAVAILTLTVIFFKIAFPVIAQSDTASRPYVIMSCDKNELFWVH